jgi:3-oxoacyl-ACP reductase-like protein
VAVAAWTDSVPDQGRGGRRLAGSGPIKVMAVAAWTDSVPIKVVAVAALPDPVPAEGRVVTEGALRLPIRSQVVVAGVDGVAPRGSGRRRWDEPGRRQRSERS